MILSGDPIPGEGRARAGWSTRSSRAIWSPARSRSRAKRWPRKRPLVRVKTAKTIEGHSPPIRKNSTRLSRSTPRRRAACMRPAAAIEAVRMTLDTPIEEGRKRSATCSSSSWSATSRRRSAISSLRAEAAKVRGIRQGRQPTRKSSARQVIGAGNYGRRHFDELTNAGIPVTIRRNQTRKPSRRAWRRSRKTFRPRCSAAAKPEDMAKRMALFTPTTDLDAIKGRRHRDRGGLENMPIKKELFAQAEKIAKPGAIPRPTPPISMWTRSRRRRTACPTCSHALLLARQVMKLLEIVRGKDTAPDVLATAMAVGRKINKGPVWSASATVSSATACCLRAGSRPRSFCWKAALRRTSTARSPSSASDGPVRDGRSPGIDVGWRSRKDAACATRSPTVWRSKAASGKKTGKGFYLYEGPRRVRSGGREAERRCLGAARGQAP